LLLADVVRGYLQRGIEVGAVLAEISAINAELLAPARAAVAGERRRPDGPAVWPCAGRGGGGGGEHDGCGVAAAAGRRR
jgi:hypothetical protein